MAAGRFWKENPAKHRCHGRRQENKKKLLSAELGDLSISEAGNAKDALMKILPQPDAIVLSDLYMPDIDGLEFMKIAKSTGKDYTFIFLTSETHQDVIDRLHLAGGMKVRLPADCTLSAPPIIAEKSLFIEPSEAHIVERLVFVCEKECVALELLEP